MGDVNGDGMTDLIWNEPLNNSSNVYVGLSQGNGSFTITPIQNFATIVMYSYQPLVGDVNGDGMADLIWNETGVNANRISVGLSRGDGTFALAPLQSLGIPGWQYYYTLVGDVNGDGMADLIWNETMNGGNYIYVGLSQGNGSFTITPLQSAGAAIGWGYFPEVGDINADGKTDLIWNDLYTTYNRIVGGLSQGDGSFALAPLQDVGASDWRNYQLLVGDINGDGKADLVWNEVFISSGCIYAGLSQGDGSFTIAQAQCF